MTLVSQEGDVCPHSDVTPSAGADRLGDVGKQSIDAVADGEAVNVEVTAHLTNL